MSLSSDIETQLSGLRRTKSIVVEIQTDMKYMIEIADLFILNSDESITLIESARDKLDTDPNDSARIFSSVVKAHRESYIIIQDFQRRFETLVKRLTL